ncbi:MAG: hypothetical protein ACTSRE_06700 [Promethearchaeota archaeon]
MVYFELNGIGFDCGIEKERCPAYPDRCMECIKGKLEELDFEVNTNLAFSEVDTPQRRLQHQMNVIWKRFLDVLNIRRILILEKESGLTLMDYPIMDTDIDPSLLSGFLHANVIFSESDGVSSKSEYWETSSTQFIEFQYRHFNLLMKTGTRTRVCLVLNQKASQTVRNTTSKFQFEFESFYSTLIDEFISNGTINGEASRAMDFLVKTFDIHLVLPLVISHTIPPTLNLNEVQATILNIARDMLGVKQYFFVNNLLENVKKSLKFKSNFVLYEIYQLLDQQVFIPTSLEEIQQNLQQYEEEKSRRVADSTAITEIITHDTEISQVEDQAHSVSSKDAEKMISNYKKSATKAEKNLIYPEALKEYEKALAVANIHGFHKEILKLTKIRGETERKNKKIELEYAINAAEVAEKKKQFLEAMRMTQKAIDIIENHLYSNGNVSKAKKLHGKLAKLRSQL